MVPFKATEEQKRFLYEYVPGHHYSEIADALNEKYSLQVTTAQIKAFITRHKLKTGFTGRFEKGRVSPQKGMKQTDFMTPEGIANSTKTRFKKGQEAHNHKPVGSERVNVYGYIEIKIAEPNVYEYKHRVIYEKEKGPIPENHCIIFRDNNKLNCSIDNLLCISKSEQAVINCHGLNRYSGELKDTALLIANAKIAASAAKRKKKEKKNEK